MIWNDLVRLARLPRGITGFGPSDPALRTSERDFKAACFAVAHRCEGAIVDLAHCGGRVFRSYLAITIALPFGEQAAVLANRAYPVVAFVDGGGYERPDPRFVEVPVLEEAFEQLSTFQPLDAGFLHFPTEPDLLTELAPSELKQITYWERTYHSLEIGQVIFNTWG